MAKMIRFLVATHFLAAAFSSFAQVVPDERTLQYLNSEPHKKLIMMIGIIYDQNIFGRKEVNRP